MSSEPGDSSRSRSYHRNLRGATSALVLGLAFVFPSVILGSMIVAQAQMDPAVLLGSVLGLVGAFALSAAFTAGETALSLLREAEVERIQEPRIRETWERRQNYASACELGGHASLVLTMLLCLPLADALQGTVQAWGVDSGLPALLTAAVIVALPVGAFHLILGRVVPKSLAASSPLRTVERLEGFIRASAAVSQPFVLFALQLGGLVTKRFGAGATLNVSNKVEEQIKAILTEAGEAHGIADEERDMLHSVFEFGDTVAREVMTPRVDIDGVPLGTELSDVARIVEESGHSRIPVYSGTDDHIVGIVHAKDLLRVLHHGEECQLADILRPAHFVPENKDLHALLQEMRQKKVQIVVVQDEYGATSGIVTVEDIVEEVVGEIMDEYDDEQPEVVKIDGGFLAEGKTNLYDLNEVAGTGFESEEFDTIGGYVFGLFGRQPKQGDVVDDGDFQFVVDGTDGRRIERLRIVPLRESTLNLGEN